jgi:hypothetical protein
LFRVHQIYDRDTPGQTKYFQAAALKLYLFDAMILNIRGSKPIPQNTKDIPKPSNTPLTQSEFKSGKMPIANLMES